MLRVLLLIALTLIPISTFAADSDTAAPKLKRWMQIMLWSGDRLETETYLPVMAGCPAYICTSSGGPTVPEGMAPAAKKIKCLIKVDYRGTAPSDPEWAANSEAQYADVLKQAQNFSLGEIDFSVLATSADRITVAIYNQALSEPKVQPNLALQVSGLAYPYGGHSESDLQEQPGYLEAWMVGSLAKPKEEPVVIPLPRKPSVTVRDD